MKKIINKLGKNNKNDKNYMQMQSWLFSVVYLYVILIFMAMCKIRFFFSTSLNSNFYKLFRFLKSIFTKHQCQTKQG